MFVFKRNIALNLRMFPCFGIWIEAAVDTLRVVCNCCMIFGMLQFAKKMEFFTRGGIRCIPRVLQGCFQCMWGPLLIGLTGNDKSSADDIVVYSTHCMYRF